MLSLEINPLATGRFHHRPAGGPDPVAGCGVWGYEGGSIPSIASGLVPWAQA